MPLQPSCVSRNASVAVAVASVLLFTAACGNAPATAHGSAVTQATSSTTSRQHVHRSHTGKPVAYDGTITAVTGHQVTLVTTTHHTVSLAVAPSTKVLLGVAGHTPTAEQASALAVGQRVRVRATAGTVAGTATQITVLIPQAASGHHAHPSPAGKTVTYAGTISGVTAQQVSLVTAAHATISLVLAPSTKVLSDVVGHTPTAVAAGSLADGQRVRVRALTGSAGLTAVQITVLRAPAASGTPRGSVTAVSHAG